MLKKRLLCLFLSGAMLMGMCGQAYAAYGQEESVSLAMNLVENIQLEAKTFENRTQPFNDEISSIQVNISEDKSLAHLTLQYQGNTYNADLVGRSETASSGYVGFFQGEMTSCDGSDSLHAIADITYTDKEMFVALTLRGYSSNDISSSVLFFGDLTEELAEISTLYAQSPSEPYEENCNEKIDMMSAAASSDTSMYLAGFSPVRINSCNLGSVCLILPQSAPNGAATSIIGKANASSANGANLEKYLLDDAGYKYTLIKGTTHLDQVNFSLFSNDSGVLLSNPGPLNSNISFTIPIPIFTSKPISIGDVIGVPTFPLKCNVSKTTVTPNGGVTKRYDWTIYKINGWSDAEISGTPGSKSGIPVSASAEYHGNVTNSYNAKISAEASLVYAYSVSVETGVVKLHMSFPSDTMTGGITIRP